MDVEKQMGLRAHQLTPTLPASMQTPTGQEYTANVGQVLAEHGPALMGIGPELAMLGKTMQPAKRAIGDSVRATSDSALEAVTPRMEPTKAALAQKAIEADIPLNVHQLSDNKFVRLAGEASEKVPMSGGKAKQRQAAFNAGLAKAIDPDATATRLTPEVFAELQDKAGQTIGDISARTPVPKESLGDLTAVARRETPDVQQVIKTYAEDFAKVADENGGVIPGDTLRRLRTEAQSQARSTSNGDLRRTLGDFIKKVDDALTEHAAEGDMEALVDARRRYAISKTLEPLVAKTTTGDISPASLMQRVTADRAGKQRMARGRGGELGDYARIGQQFLKEQATSNTSERNLVYRAFTDAVTAGKAAAALSRRGGVQPAGAQGREVDGRAPAQAHRRAPARRAGPPPEPTLGQGFEDVPPRGGGGPASPLGDLVPDWEVVPGAAPERPPGMSADGLVPAVDDAGGDYRPPQGPARRAGDPGCRGSPRPARRAGDRSAGRVGGHAARQRGDGRARRDRGTAPPGPGRGRCCRRGRARRAGAGGRGHRDQARGGDAGQRAERPAPGRDRAAQGRHEVGCRAQGPRPPRRRGEARDRCRSGG